MSQTNNRRVAVTGLGVISPIGNCVETCWDNLKKGTNGIGPITHFDTADFKAKLAAEVKDFDPQNYMEKAEIYRSDKYAQYGFAAACQAMEDSQLVEKIKPERMAVYFGSGIGGIGTLEETHEKLMKKGPRQVSPYFVPRMILNIVSGMIAIRYNCQGPALPAVTACASGSNAVGEAYRAIKHGYVDAAITGGTEAAITQCGVAGFANMKALCLSEDPNAASLPFDKRRSGFVIGEGSAALILEEYEHAKKRGATIYGEICGYGATCDAYHITAPHPEGNGAVRAMEQALNEAGFEAGDKIYINAHGTGTLLNDASETAAIKRVFGEKQAKEVLISSTKSMTGHMLGAAGAIEAIACVKALQEGIIPPTINLQEADPACDLNYVPNKAVNAEIKFALSNSLGFGGHNASLVFKRV